MVPCALRAAHARAPRWASSRRSLPHRLRREQAPLKPHLAPTLTCWEALENHFPSLNLSFLICRMLE